MVVTLSNMEERLESSNGGKKINGREAIDMLMFLYDMTSSVTSFLGLFPQGSKLLFRVPVATRYFT